MLYIKGHKYNIKGTCTHIINGHTVNYTIYLNSKEREQNILTKLGIYSKRFAIELRGDKNAEDSFYQTWYADRFNPYNPLSYICILICTVICFFTEGINGVKESYKHNPFDYEIHGPLNWYKKEDVKYEKD